MGLGKGDRRTPARIPLTQAKPFGTAVFVDRKRGGGGGRWVVQSVRFWIAWRVCGPGGVEFLT